MSCSGTSSASGLDAPHQAVYVDVYYLNLSRESPAAIHPEWLLKRPTAVLTFRRSDVAFDRILRELRATHTIERLDFQIDVRWGIVFRDENGVTLKSYFFDRDGEGMDVGQGPAYSVRTALIAWLKQRYSCIL